MTNNVRIDCPNCGHPVIVRTTSVDDADPETAVKGFKPWPTKENREKIFAHADEMWKSVDAHFRKIFHPDLWR